MSNAGVAELADAPDSSPGADRREGSSPSSRTCSPIIKPCDSGRFKLSCKCGLEVHPRFATPHDAERMWARHAMSKMEKSE